MTITAPATGLHSEAVMRVVLENPGSNYQQIRQEVGGAMNEQDVFNAFIALVRMSCIHGIPGSKLTDPVRYHATAKGVRLLDRPMPAKVERKPEPKGDNGEILVWIVAAIALGMCAAWMVSR